MAMSERDVSNLFLFGCSSCLICGKGWRKDAAPSIGMTTICEFFTKMIVGIAQG